MDLSKVLSTIQPGEFYNSSTGSSTATSFASAHSSFTEGTIDEDIEVETSVYMKDRRMRGTIGFSGVELPQAIQTAPPLSAQQRECKILCEVVEKFNPYKARHGQGKAAWEEVATELRNRGYFHDRDGEYIKRRMVDLIKFKESPGWKPGIEGHEGERILGSNKFGITAESLISLVAPLEKVAHLREEALQRKDEQVFVFFEYKSVW
ncbi:hypothetical protein K440DRAFT_616009 [Wilcoxina mikolae CBS 423.85]|nr:hypothetical protein K440DRAFT_616009 [Wilcoxina mikolae CBS 423.85]